MWQQREGDSLPIIYFLGGDGDLIAHCRSIHGKDGAVVDSISPILQLRPFWPSLRDVMLHVANCESTRCWRGLIRLSAVHEGSEVAPSELRGNWRTVSLARPHPTPTFRPKDLLGMWAGYRTGLRYYGKIDKGKRRASCDLTVDNHGNLSTENSIQDSLVGLGAKIAEGPQDLG